MMGWANGLWPRDTSQSTHYLVVSVIVLLLSCCNPLLLLCAIPAFIAAIVVGQRINKEPGSVSNSPFSPLVSLLFFPPSLPPSFLLTPSFPPPPPPPIFSPPLQGLIEGRNEITQQRMLAAAMATGQIPGPCLMAAAAGRRGNPFSRGRSKSMNMFSLVCSVFGFCTCCLVTLTAIIGGILAAINAAQ